MCWVPVVGQTGGTHAISFIHHTSLLWSEKQTQPGQAKSLSCVPKAAGRAVAFMLLTPKPELKPGQTETTKVTKVGKRDQIA